jgi:hypothetical protein
MKIVETMFDGTVARRCGPKVRLSQRAKGLSMAKGFFTGIKIRVFFAQPNTDLFLILWMPF